MLEKPAVTAELIWARDLEFGATVGTNALVVDSDGGAGPSPVQLLAVALAACMSIDIVDILKKGRHSLTAFRSKLSGQRAPTPPRRLLAVEMEFTIHGEVPPAVVERAIALSRQKYCSVWHSLRQDIELTTTFVIHP